MNEGFKGLKKISDAAIRKIRQFSQTPPRVERQVHSDPPMPIEPSETPFQPHNPIELPLAQSREAPTILFRRDLPLSETKEIPRDYLVVIAEAQDDDRLTIADFARTATPTEGYVNRVIAPNNARDFFRAAMWGKGGKPADAVLLSMDSKKIGAQWMVPQHKVEEFLTRLGGDFTTSMPKNLRDLSDDPSNINYAFLLDALRFPGKKYTIFSGAVPSAPSIAKRAEEIRALVPKYPQDFPIDGYSLKHPYPTGVIYLATGLENGDWDTFSTEGEGLKTSLKILLGR